MVEGVGKRGGRGGVGGSIRMRIRVGRGALEGVVVWMRSVASVVVDVHVWEGVWSCMETVDNVINAWRCRRV